MSNMRIFGLASGMDIDQIVTDMMKAERTKVDKVEQDKQILEWRRKLYNDINKDFANFILDMKKELELNKTSSTGVISGNSINNLSWIKKATSADETLASVSSTAAALEGSYSLTVKQLATNFSTASSSSITTGASKANIADQFGLADDDTIKFTIETKNGSKEFEYTNLKDINLNKIVSDINNAKVTVNDKEVSLGVKAVYDSSIDRFFLQTEETGVDNYLRVEDTSLKAGGSESFNFIAGDDTSTSNLLNLSIKDYKVTDSTTTYAGQNALIDFAGAIGIEQSSNQFTINGVNFDLKNADPDKAFTVKVDTNIDGVYDKISKFVEKYNELVDKVSGILGEKKYRDFRPLSKEQKEAMNEKEAELWEEKAKSGLLKNDSILTSTMQSARSWMYEEVQGVTGVFDHLTEIGITTEKYSSGSAGGKLEIDETKLKEAIRDNADSVIGLLFKESTSISSLTNESTLTKEQIQTKRQESGIITRLFDNLIGGMKDIINKAGPGDSQSLYRDVKSNLLIDFVTDYGSISMLDEDIFDLEDKINDLNSFLARTEERYYSKFTAMEKAIQQMNSQSSWLAQQFGGM